MFDLTEDDRCALKGKGWLTDNIMWNFATILLEKHSWKTSCLVPFYLCRKQPWTGEWFFDNNVVKHVERSELHILFLCNGKHWILCKIFPRAKTVLVFDTYGPLEPEKDLRKGVDFFVKNFKTKLYEGDDCQWQVMYRSGSLCYNDGYNCGTYCLLQLECHLTGKVPEDCFTLDDYRAKIRRVLLNWPCEKESILEKRWFENDSDTSQDHGSHKGQSENNHKIAESGENTQSSPYEIRQLPASEKTCPQADLYSEYDYIDILSALKTKEEIVMHVRIFEEVDGHLRCKLCKSRGKKFCVTAKNSNDILFNQRFYELKYRLKKHLQKEHSGPKNEIPPDSVKRCKTLVEILQFFPVFKQIDDRVICTLCHSPASKCGVFDVKESSLFKSKAFLNLKQRLETHLTLRTHQLKLQDDEGASKRLENFRAGMVVANNAYRVLKRSDSFASLEAEIQLDFNKGLSPGDINHSIHVMSWFPGICAAALRDRLKFILATPLESTGKLRPIAAAVDKFTLGSKSFQIVGLFVPYKGRLEYFFCDAQLVGINTDGQGLASLFIKSVSQFCNPTQLVAAAADGQYHQLKVFKHFCKNLGFTEEHESFCTFSWDAAHLLELAASDSRGQHGNPDTMSVTWIKTTVKTISETSRRYKWGKKAAEMEEVAQEILAYDIVEDLTSGKKVLKKTATPKTLKTWSNTRFSAHLYNFLDSFLGNFNALVALSRGDESLMSIRTTAFVLRLTFLLDFYKIIGISSKVLQKSQSLPWLIHREFEALLKTFESIIETLNGPRGAWGASTYLVNLNNCINEIAFSGSFRGETVLNIASVPHSGRTTDYGSENSFFVCVEDERKNFIEAATAFHSSLKIRFQQQLHAYTSVSFPRPMLSLLPPIFDMSKVQLFHSDEPPEELSYIYQTFKRTLDWESSWESICSEYREFLRYLRSANVSQTWDEEVNFYMGLLDKQTNFPNIAHLLASACMRSYCEAIIEGNGSIANNIFRGRECLGNKSFLDTLFTKINGPALGDDSQRFLEEVLTRKFGEISKWHFIRTSAKRNVTAFAHSKVVDKLNKRIGKLN